MAGGRGTRLGTVPKALLEIGGRTVLDRTLDALGPLVDEQLVVVSDAAFPLPSEVRQIMLRQPHPTPLPGVAEGLAAARGAVCLLVASDMPFVSRAVFARLLAIQAETGAVAVVPRVGAHLESLHAVVSREPLRAAIDHALAAGEARLFEVFEALGTRLTVVPEAELRAIDPELRSLTDVDTPADLAAAIELARTARYGDSEIRGGGGPGDGGH
jgi:molybdopterin-guanine dinucleotide biosynthesis protein A